MIGMQYKVLLPEVYDMELIRSRVRENGHKMDGFPGLRFKAFLIKEKHIRNNLYNSYSPLYIWDESEGMNQFLFEGYYDNILSSFGWQHIHVGVPFNIQLNGEFHKSKYVVEFEGRIEKTNTLRNPSIMNHNHFYNNQTCLGSVTVYNPDKWGYSYFAFFETEPVIENGRNLSIYEVLHISMGAH